MSTGIINRMTGKLIIVRHHQSEWNKLGLWTGLYDAHLDPYGVEQSREMGVLIKDLPVDHAYTSALVRTHETLTHMLGAIGRQHIPATHAPELNERDYGDYTGKNKWDIEKLIGAEEFKKLRRSWDYTIPGGESLKMVHERVVPFYCKQILPRIRGTENILVVAHGNSLRALIKYIEDISHEDIAEVEMPFGAVVMYELGDEGRMARKEHRQIASSSLA